MENISSPLTYLLLTLFLGPIGVHRFYRKQIGLGILYLLTGGLFFIGWIIDLINAIKFFINQKNNNTNPNQSDHNVDHHTTYYWTDNGNAYHLYRFCSKLRHSQNIHSGTLEQAKQAGKVKKCKECFYL